MSITRTAWTDDDGTGTTGTVINNSEKTTLYDQIDGRWSEATTTSTGNQDDFAYSEADVIRANNASTVTFRGLLAPASPTKPGKPLTIYSLGAGTVVLNNQDTNSSAANRIITGTGAAVTLTAGTGWAVVVYDSSTARWRLLGSSASGGGTVGTSTITTTGTSTALALPTGTGPLVIIANNATLLNVQGIAAGTDGQQLTIFSKGAGQVDFNHQNGSATAANRLINTVTSGVTSLAAGSGYASFIYDATATRWRLETHEQGAWIAFTPTITFGGASTGQTFTLHTGRYWVKGVTVAIFARVLFSSKGSATGTALMESLPYTAVNVSGVAPIANFWGNNFGAGIANLSATVIANDTKVNLYKFAAGAVTGLADTDFTNTSDTDISVVYETS